MNEYNSFFNTVEGAEGDKCYYPTRLDTYGKGCFYDCKYCYAKSLLDFRELWNPKNPGVAPLSEILKTLKNIRSGDVIRLGGMTDCFQPIEKKYRNTYFLIKLLNKRRIHYLIVTKSDLIVNEEYLKILDKELAHIQVSIPTTDNDVLRFTDNAKSFETRKNVVEELYSNDFDVSLRLSPFLYDSADFDKLNSINVDKCLVEFLRIKQGMKKIMKNCIDSKYYVVKEGSYRHLPLFKKLEVLRKLDFKEMTVCDDVQKHYDYFQENFNFNKNDCCNLRL